MNETNIKYLNIFIFTTLATSLQLSESVMPGFFPGMKFGFANIITLTAICILGFKAGIIISIFRTLLSSFILGTFMSPTFILSFCGATSSALIMGLIVSFPFFNKRLKLSLIGVSVLGSLTHNTIQTFLAYILIIHHKNIFLLYPLISISAVVSGVITGIMSKTIISKLEQKAKGSKDTEKSPILIEDFNKSDYCDGNTPIHMMNPFLKFLFLISGIGIILLLPPYLSIPPVLTSIVLAIYLSKIPFSVFYSKIRKFSILILFSFLFPVIFNFLNFKVFGSKINYEEAFLVKTLMYPLKLMILILMSSIFVSTTNSEKLNFALSKCFIIFRPFGFSQIHLALIFESSWKAIPALQSMILTHFKKNFSFKELKNFNPFVFIPDLIAYLYEELNFSYKNKLEIS